MIGTSLIIKIAIITACVVMGIGSRYYFQRRDNHIEQAMEEIIKEQTGMDVDLSPEEN